MKASNVVLSVVFACAAAFALPCPTACAADSSGAHVFARYDSGTNIVSRLVPDGTDVATMGAVDERMALQPAVYSDRPAFTEWEYSGLDSRFTVLSGPRYYPQYEGWYCEVAEVASGTSYEAYAPLGDANATNLVAEFGSDLGTFAFTATRTRTDIIGYTFGSQTNKLLASAEPLLFAQYYPDGSVKSTAEFTPNIKYGSFDDVHRIVSVLPFCNLGTVTNDNSSLGGRVVIPPFVDGSGKGYITDDGTRYKVSGIASPHYTREPDAQTNTTGIVAPTTVLYVGDGSFSGCAGLVSASFPTAETVDAGAFDRCASLVSMSLPDASGLLGDNVFWGCTSLRSVYIPRIDELSEAFMVCTSLESVDFGDTPRQAVPTLSPYTFDGVPTSCKFIVPDAQYDAWTAATLPDGSSNRWYTLVTKGYKFLRHSEWGYARKYEALKTEWENGDSSGSRLVESGSGVDFYYRDGDWRRKSRWGMHGLQVWGDEYIELTSGDAPGLWVGADPFGDNNILGGGFTGYCNGFVSLGRSGSYDYDEIYFPTGVGSGRDNVFALTKDITAALDNSPSLLHVTRYDGMPRMTNDMDFVGRNGYLQIAPASGSSPMLYVEGDVLTRGGCIMADSWDSFRVELPDEYPDYAETLPQFMDRRVAGKASKADVDPLLFAQYYPDGSVKSAAEFTSGIKYNNPDTTNRTITVKPFCNTGIATNDNSSLGGRVVIPPFVDGSGKGYITDDGTRYKVVGVSDAGPNDPNVKLTAVIAPNTVTNIGDEVFASCNALTSVSLPAAATIGGYAFSFCSVLTSVSLPAATNIEDSAFFRCPRLHSVSLPAATTIGGHAFDHCTSLSSIDFGDTPRLSVPALGLNVFVSVTNTCKIIVPYAQYDAWKAADGWKDLPQEFVRHAEKSDKPTTFTAGNLAKFDANGNPADSGKSLEDIQSQIDTESPLLARSYAVQRQTGWREASGATGTAGNSVILFRPRYFGMRDGDLFKGIVLQTRADQRTVFSNGVYMRLRAVPTDQSAPWTTLGVSELTVWPDTSKTDVVFRLPRAVSLPSSGGQYALDFVLEPDGGTQAFGMMAYGLQSGSNPDFYFAFSTIVPVATVQFYSWEELTGADIAVSGTNDTTIAAALVGKANDVDVVHKRGDTMTGSLHVNGSLDVDYTENGITASIFKVTGSAANPTRFIYYDGISNRTLYLRDIASSAGKGHAGNLAALDANGNPTDSGIAKTNVVTKSGFPAELSKALVGREMPANPSDAELRAAVSNIWEALGGSFR